MPAFSSINLNEILRWLRKRGAGSIQHGGDRSLRDHLHGTMRILSHWGQPTEVVAAGLLHSIYSTDIFPHSLCPLSDRKSVRKIAGNEVEQLVYLFCTIRRTSLFLRMAEVKNHDWGELLIDCHRGSAQIAIPREQVGSLLVIYMANAAEQTRNAENRPGLWISAASRWGLWARPLVKHAPPVFNSCATLVSFRDEQQARQKYLAGLDKFAQDRGAALSDFLSAADKLPWIAEPFVFLSLIALLDQRWPDAYRFGVTALKRLSEWGTCWDHRYSFAQWKVVAETILGLSEKGFTRPVQTDRLVQKLATASSSDWMQTLRSFSQRPRLLEELPSEVESAAKPSKDSSAARSEFNSRALILPKRFSSYMAEFKREDQKPKHNFYPGLSKVEVYPVKQFAIAQALERAYPEIKAEFDRLHLGLGFQKESESIKRTGSWNVFLLYEQGRRNDPNCDRCPMTESLVKKYGAVHSVWAAVYFSVLAPHSHISAHTGPTNMRVRCHLGIEVPQGCRLRVGDQTLTWRSGKCLIFDDSFNHEVWNDSDEHRVVLVVDLWHPDLKSDEVNLLDGLQRYVHAHAKGMMNYWARNANARAAHIYAGKPQV